MHGLEAFFATVRLPSMSAVAHDLIRTLDDDDVGVTEVRDIIARDPALSARLLRLANSAQFGLPRGVGTLDEAIQMVGMSRVRSLSVGVCLSDSFPPLPGLDLQEFWRSSMACAGYAQWLAGALDMDAQQAWLTGMLLRLGELLMGQARPEVVAQVESTPHLPGERWNRQRRLLGFAEGQVTAELARRWNFPMQMVHALERSFDPLVEQAFSRLGAVINLAGLLADTPGADARAVDHLPPDVIATLKLDPRWMKATFPDAGSFVQWQAAA